MLPSRAQGGVVYRQAMGMDTDLGLTSFNRQRIAWYFYLPVLLTTYLSTRQQTSSLQ